MLLLENLAKKIKIFCGIKYFVLPLHPQISNDGGIAQLVRASDS